MISFQNFSFRYEESKDFTLRGIDMTVQTGEFVLLTGRSGCGKTTLIRSLNGLIPHFYPGEIQGDLVMDGHSLLEMKPAQLAGQVGTVFQDPRSQFFMTDTTRELAFGCENMGLPREETIDRIAKAAKDLELADYLNRSIFALSSGEKQQIAVGSVYALSPKVYIFDEPSANLDYAATKRLAEIMGKLKRDGYTIFVVEHRFYYLRDLIDRVFLIQNGKIEQEFTREQFCSLPEETRISYGLRTAYPERDAEHYQEKERRPMGKHLLSVQGLSFAYPKEQEVFRNVSFEAHAGDVIGILGHNGAGKTTLLSILTGLLKQRNGEITFDGRKLTPRQRRALSYLVMQDTDYQLFASSVEEELSLGIREDCKEKVDAALELVQLLDAGDVVNGVVDVWVHKREERRIPLRVDAVNRLLGTQLDKAQMVNILLPLGFGMDGDDIVISSSRWDMERDCDVAEEVARFVGYNKMPSTAIRGVASARPTERQTFHETLMNALVGYGMYEIETFSFYSRKAFDAVNLPENDPLRNALVISNPLGEDTSIMRTTRCPA